MSPARTRLKTTFLFPTPSAAVATHLKYVDAPVALSTWHTLRVEFQGARIKAMLNGKTYIELGDRHIPGPGSVGVWTKADGVTAFDDFAFGSTSGR